jgi:hypothetical protein
LLAAAGAAAWWAGLRMCRLSAILHYVHLSVLLLLLLLLLLPLHALISRCVEAGLRGKLLQRWQ